MRIIRKKKNRGDGRGTRTMLSFLNIDVQGVDKSEIGEIRGRKDGLKGTGLGKHQTTTDKFNSGLR